MKRKFVSYCIISVFAFAFIMQQEVKASFMDVLNTINYTSNTINSVNRATRGTLSTVEYGQRFQDRQQDRQDYKRAQKGYNESAQEEYYKTLQETKMLEAQYNSNAGLRVDL